MRFDTCSFVEKADTVSLVARLRWSSTKVAGLATFGSGSELDGVDVICAFDLGDFPEEGGRGGSSSVRDECWFDQVAFFS